MLDCLLCCRVINQYSIPKCQLMTSLFRSPWIRMTVVMFVYWCLLDTGLWCGGIFCFRTPLLPDEVSLFFFSSEHHAQFSTLLTAFQNDLDLQLQHFISTMKFIEFACCCLQSQMLHNVHQLNANDEMSSRSAYRLFLPLIAYTVLQTCWFNLLLCLLVVSVDPHLF
jgi:hypothetical protein